MMRCVFCFVQGRSELRAQAQQVLAGGAGRGARLKSAEAPAPDETKEKKDVTAEFEGVRQDMDAEDLKRWESAYKLRPAPSARPSEWSVDDLCVMLESRGLADCVEG